MLVPCEYCERNDAPTKQYPRAQIAEHKAAECAFVFVECESCAEKVRLQAKEKHELEECPKRLVRCEVCAQSLPFDAMESHDITRCYAGSGFQVFRRQQELIDELREQLTSRGGEVDELRQDIQNCRRYIEGLTLQVQLVMQAMHQNTSFVLQNSQLLRQKTLRQL